MIVLKVTLRVGRSEEMKEALHRRLTDAAVEAFGADLADIRSVIYEVPPANWAKSGVPLGDPRGEV